MQLDAEKTKAFFASRTALWNILGIVTAWFMSWRFPKFRESVCNNQEISVTLGLLLFTAFCSVNLFLRKITSCRIGAALLVLLLASGCGSFPQKLNPDVRYRNDLPFCVEGFACFEGVTVLPRMAQYKFEISPKGDAEVDLLVVTTCNRNKTFERGEPGAGWGFLSYFGKFFGKKKEGFTYLYVPIPGKEDTGDCPLMLQTYEKRKGRHAWSLIKFEHPKYTLPATLYCDGEIKQSTGSSICQGKTGLTQWVKFRERVMIEPGITERDTMCSMPKRDSTGDYAWQITNEECGYTVRGESGRLHDLTATGYTGELIREVK